ncbi:MAG: DUF2490 domain-containing protein [Spirosomaceae bacterium]|jgi:hypothetical protein|nr:DUF2490 domain-containing protein [Spirosomataceae bacterium]
MKYYRLIVCFLCVYYCQAQDLSLRGLVTNYSQVGRINKKWNYNVQVLSVYNASNLNIGDKSFPSGHCHFVPHFLVNRKINDRFSVGGGIAYGRHNIFGLKESEPRLMIQGAYNQKFKKLSLNHRGRLELRYPLNLSTQIRDNATIMRYQLGVSYLLYNPKEFKKGLYGLVSNEMFLYLKGATNGPVSSRNGLLLSEDWINLGLGYNTGKNRIEVGYGFQSLVRNKKQDMRYLNMLQINYHVTLNWDDLQGWWYM